MWALLGSQGLNHFSQLKDGVFVAGTLGLEGRHLLLQFLLLDFKGGTALHQLDIPLLEAGPTPRLLDGKQANVLQVLGSLLHAVSRDVVESDFCSAAEHVELAVDRAIRAELLVFLGLAEPYIGDGAAVGAGHVAVGAVCVVKLGTGSIGPTLVIAHLTLLMPILALSSHVSPQTQPREGLFAAKRTEHGYVHALASLLPHIEVGTQVFKRPEPLASFALHGAVDLEAVDAIAELSVKERREAMLFAHGAHLVHGEDPGDAPVAVMLTAARREVWVVHHREADRATTVLRRLLCEANVKRCLVGRGISPIRLAPHSTTHDHCGTDSRHRYTQTTSQLGDTDSHRPRHSWEIQIHTECLQLKL